MTKIGLIIHDKGEVLVLQDRDERCHFISVEKKDQVKSLLGIDIELEEACYVNAEDQEFFLASLTNGWAKYEGEERMFWIPVDLLADVDWKRPDEIVRLSLQKQGLDHSF